MIYMAISTMFFKQIEYFRITRTWDYRKTKIQEYVRIRTHKNKSKNTKLREKAKLEAQAIDDALKQRQINDRLIKQINGESFFHPTGKIVGINRVSHFRTRRDSGQVTDVHEFAVRYNKRNGKHPRTGSISIHMHGLERAYELAVNKFAVLAGIDHNKPLIKLMMDSFKYYQNDPTLKNHGFDYDGRGKRDNLPVLEQRLKIDFEESGKKLGVKITSKIEKNLLKELEDYQRKNPLTKHFGKNSPVPKDKRAKHSGSGSPARW